MRIGIPTIAAATVFFKRLATAQTVQDSWITPSPPDFTSNLTIGEFYLLSWNSNLVNSFAPYAPSADVNSVDLWITDYNLHVYSHLIAARQNLNVITSLSWRVDVSPEELLDTNQWVFRWLPQGVNYSETSEQISSPGFFLQNISEPAATTTSSIPASTVITFSESSTPVTETPTASATKEVTTSVSGADGASAATTAPISSTVSHGLSTGAKAGIAVGSVIGAALLFGIGWVLARKIRKRHADGTGEMQPNGIVYQDELKSDIFMQQQYVPTTKPPHYISELDSSLSRAPSTHELPAR
ncbi:hypothetical protein CLCR_03049 [Cladophialophora carrionii]|uniref:Mid2 domain-containing protein n=1 Tax=Cladophialophora carrionii TaxID=86049 RepID=A0A1C1D1I4_9EURO|nr:hypothetical protein CLCR_03049 [Cladophialophora carrionii]